MLFIIAFLTLRPARASAATLRVPQNYASIEAAYDAAVNGDEILVAPGNYNVCLSGNRSKMLAIKAQYPAATSPAAQQSVLNSACSHVIQFNTPLDNDGIFQPGDHVEFVGFVLKGSDDGFSYEGASGIVKDNIITGQSDDPIDIDGASEAHIFANILKDGVGGGDGIENRLYSIPGTREIKIIIRNNIIFNSINDGIQLIDQTGSKTLRKYLIANNLIINNGQAGLGTTQGGNSSQTDVGYTMPESIYVLHNTFIGNSWGAIIGGANMKVHNNIFYNNGKVAVKNVSGQSVVSHNLFFGNAFDHQGSNLLSPNLFSDPKFTNTSLPPSLSSFALQSGSPAINAGLNVNNYYQEFSQTPPDFTGTAPDLGWQESGMTILPTNLPTPTLAGPHTDGKPGDANADNKVDGVDYVIWLSNYNQSKTGNTFADFNNNGFVDGLDYVIWLNNYNK